MLDMGVSDSLPREEDVRYKILILDRFSAYLMATQQVSFLRLK
jgi:hypothetical protein